MSQRKIYAAGWYQDGDPDDASIESNKPKPYLVVAAPEHPDGMITIAIPTTPEFLKIHGAYVGLTIDIPEDLSEIPHPGVVFKLPW
jgi:hypothetical protein